ncbi:MAG: phosphoribosylformimino-5-aminoimidazole carboxamide ribotide isomerase, partial [Lachnospiraceae bacterium]
MKFRPCIDIHNGKVKQIVGGSLKDEGDRARENFVSRQDAPFYARLYRQYGLEGGHIILLNPWDSPYYEVTKRQAMLALKAYPGGLQVGGGITCENASDFLRAGASKVIVTSYVFKNGEIDYGRLKALSETVGRERLVLDLSCRRKGGQYYIVTDRWQKFTHVVLNKNSLELFSEYADEFLIHAVDVEGKARGIEQEVVKLLGEWGKLPMTYAGGIHRYEDLELLESLGRNRVDFT